MKPLFSKRILSYFIDLFIVFCISALITSFIPISEKAQGLSENMNDVVSMLSEKKIDFKQYANEINNINYELTKETVISTLVSIIVYILYFVVYPVYNNGQTVGKKMFRLKIINSKNQQLTFNNLLFREMILHSIALNIIVTVLVLFLNKSQFISLSNMLSIIQEIIFIVIIIMIILKKDGRGLHDIVGNTIVISEEERK